MCAHVCLVLPAFDANLQSTIAARVHAVISVFAIAYRTDSRARACLDILAFCATYQLTIVTRIHAKTELRVQAVCHCPTCTFADARQDFMVITARFSLIHAVWIHAANTDRVCRSIIIKRSNVNVKLDIRGLIVTRLLAFVQLIHAWMAALAIQSTPINTCASKWMI